MTRQSTSQPLQPAQTAPHKLLRHLPPSLRGARGAALAGTLLLLLAAVLRTPLEASMALHMLLQLPMLVIAGALLGHAARHTRAAAMVARIDAYGFTGLAVLMFASAYWMIPRALELPLTIALAELAKFASLLLTGALLPGALARANIVIQMFFVGNLTWMMAIAGIQYQDMPQRLCNAYALDDQIVTGVGLVLMAIGIGVAWCAWQLPQAAAAAENKA